MYKNTLEGKTAVIFDMDGTIVDTEPLWKQAFDNVLRPLGISWMDHSQFPTGTTIQVRWDLILSKYSEYISSKVNSKELVRQTSDEYLKILSTNPLEEKEGFWDLAYFLKVEKKLKLALATNTSEKEARATLQKIGAVETFEVLTFGDSVKTPKPDPEIYLNTAKALGAAAGQILVFEDSPVGAHASVRAGMDTVVIWNGSSPKLDYPTNNVLAFLPNFSGLDHTLNTTIEDDIKMAAEDIEQ